MRDGQGRPIRVLFQPSQDLFSKLEAALPVN